VFQVLSDVVCILICFFKQKAAYDQGFRCVGSRMCITPRLRGLPGAMLLEDLCDAIGGRYEPDGPIEDGDELTDRMTVAEGMTMLGISKFEAFAVAINASVGSMTYWRTKKGGVMPAKHVKIVQQLYRGMQVREAA